MALPDTLKFGRGTTKVFSNSGEYVPTDNQPSGTDADIDLQSLGTTPDYRQSAQMDLGSANLDALYVMAAYIEYFSSPTAGGTVDFYLGWSSDGSDLPAGLSGSDAAYNGYGAAAADATEAVKQLEYIGSLVVTADTAIQSGIVGSFQPKARYCYLVVANNSSVALANTDAIETAVAITPLQHQVQD